MPARLRRGRDGQLHRTLGVQVPLALWEAVDDAAHDARERVSDLVRAALEREVARRTRLKEAREAAAAKKGTAA